MLPKDGSVWDVTDKAPVVFPRPVNESAAAFELAVLRLCLEERCRFQRFCDSVRAIASLVIKMKGL